MKKILFACDLDNTLIHSLRHKSPEDVCIEMIKDKEQGFITKKTIELLKKVNALVEFLPVTTRSVEQYLRIRWEDGCEPEYAITTNGGILLKGNQEVTSWGNKKLTDTHIHQNEFKRIMENMQESNLFIRCRMVDGLYLFGYCKDGVSIEECRAKYAGLTHLSVVASGRKLYIFPSQLNKGVAVAEFAKQFGFDTVFCAGDSVIDVPMLEIADIAFVPAGGLENTFPGKKKIACPKDENFAEFILSKILELNNHY